jgi:hypothetical protein
LDQFPHQIQHKETLVELTTVVQVLIEVVGEVAQGARDNLAPVPLLLMHLVDLEFLFLLLHLH